MLQRYCSVVQSIVELYIRHITTFAAICSLGLLLLLQQLVLHLLPQDGHVLIYAIHFCVVVQRGLQNKTVKFWPQLYNAIIQRIRNIRLQWCSLWLWQTKLTPVFTICLTWNS